MHNFLRIFCRATSSEEYTSHLPPLPPHTQSPQPPIPHWRIPINEPVFTHYYLPKAVVCVKVVPACCCAFYGLGQTCTDLCPPLQCWTEWFQCSKTSPCSAYSSFLPQPRYALLQSFLKPNILETTAGCWDILHFFLHLQSPLWRGCTTGRAISVH